MKYSAFYLVRPRSALELRAASLGVGLEGWLEAPIVFESVEVGRSPWLQADRVLQMKLTFLIWLRSEYEAEADFRTLFPSMLRGVDDFDEWWVLEVVNCIDTESAEEQFRGQVVASMQGTGNELVDAWLRRLVSKR